MGLPAQPALSALSARNTPANPPFLFNFRHVPAEIEQKWRVRFCVAGSSELEAPCGCHNLIHDDHAHLPAPHHLPAPPVLNESIPEPTLDRESMPEPTLVMGVGWVARLETRTSLRPTRNMRVGRGDVN